MLKTPQSHGYSSKVRCWLVINGHKHDVAQVGPDFCILRKAIAVTCTPAEIIIEIDNDPRTSLVQLVSTDGTLNRRLAFTAT